MKVNYKKIILTTLLIGTISGCSLLVSDSMIKSAHQNMDKNHDGYIDYNEYLSSSKDGDITKEAKEKGMTIEEYQKWDYNRADANRDGKITEQELIDLFHKEF